MKNYYLLIDCNNFFVSCERVFRPDLQGKPVVVLSSNDGCIIARSNEAKALGIGMGVPLFKVKDIIKRFHVETFSSNHTLYVDFSRRVMSLLRMVSPAIEVYSIDEAFADMRGVDESFDIENFAKKIIKLIKKGCGIPVSIGIAPTKTLAKLASHMVKKGLMGGDGICKLTEKEEIEYALKITNVGDIWGIGRRSVVNLCRNGIESGLDFVRTSPSWVKMNMSVTGLRIWKELNSEPAIEFDGSDDDSRKSIMVSRSFTREISDFEELATVLANFITSGVRKLRKQNSAAKQITVFVQTNRFSKVQQVYNESLVHSFEVACDNLTEMIELGIKLLKQIYRDGVSYKKCGVILTSLIDKSEVIATIFDNVDRSRQSRLMEVIDDINLRHGKNSIVSARRGYDKLPVSKENMSPSYTTCWSDILIVK